MNAAVDSDVVARILYNVYDSGIPRKSVSFDAVFEDTASRGVRRTLEKRSWSAETGTDPRSPDLVKSCSGSRRAKSLQLVRLG